MSFHKISKKRRWAVLFALTLGTAVVFLDSTIMPVTLPTIQKEFSLSQSGMQWVINAYLLVIGCLILAGGKVSDLLGHKKMYCVGKALFGVASILGGLSQTEAFLLFSRALQGLGGAIMIPSSMSILMENYLPKERGRAVGFIVGVGSLFLSMGPFVGGYFTQYMTWRLVFWINIPIVLIGITIAILAIPKSEKLKETFDVFGFFAYTSALICLILGLMQAREWGWSSPAVISLFSLFLFFVAVLIFSLKKVKHPFFDYHLFKNKVFLGGNIIIGCAQFLIMMTTYWVIYFQKTLGYSPLESGAMVLTSTLPLFICGPLSGYLSDHFGPRIPVLMGFALMTLGFIWVAFLGGDPVAKILITGLVCFGSGIAIVMTPVGTTTISAVPNSKRGVASGMYSTVRNTASPLSIAILGTLIVNISFFEFKKRVFENPRFRNIDFKYYANAILEGQPLTQNPDNLTPNLIASLKQSYYLASKTAYFWTNLLCAGVSILGFVICLHYFKKAAFPKDPDQTTAV